MQFAVGKKFADLHVNYESAKVFPLKRQENKEVKLDWRVEAMKLSKDKASLFYNDFLTLSGIPAGRASVLASPNLSWEVTQPVIDDFWPL